MRKWLMAVALATMIFSFTGCGILEEMSAGESQYVSASGNVAEQYGHFVDRSGHKFDAEDRLVYDTFTKIVYIKTNELYGNDTYVPYYAPNGLPYRYDPKTDTLEEIEKE